MATKEEVVILGSIIGPIALSSEQLRAARRDGEAWLEEIAPIHRPNSAYKAYLGADAIAALFSVDATWFLSRAREGRIPHIKLGKYVRFDPDEIRTYFAVSDIRHADSEET